MLLSGVSEKVFIQKCAPMIKIKLTKTTQNPNSRKCMLYKITAAGLKNPWQALTKKSDQWILWSQIRKRFKLFLEPDETIWQCNCDKSCLNDRSTGKFEYLREADRSCQSKTGHVTVGLSLKNIEE